MTKNADAYGAKLWDYYTTKKDNREIVERDDNFIDGDVSNEEEGKEGRERMRGSKNYHGD
jgi:hypothetical protein